MNKRSTAICGENMPYESDGVRGIPIEEHPPMAARMAHWERLLERTFLPGRVRGDLQGRIDRIFHLERMLVAELSLAPQSIEHTARHLQAFPCEKRATVVAHVVLDGAGFVEQNGTRIPFKRGDVTFRSFSSPSVVAFTEPTRIYSIQLPAEIVGLRQRSAYASAGVMPKVVDSAGPSAQAARQLLCGLAADATSALERLCALTAVPWLIAGAYYSVSGPSDLPRMPNPSRWQSILSYIERHLFDPDTLSPSACAASVGISTGYLHKLFSQRGLRFTQLVLDRRLDAARMLLTDTTYKRQPIASIAYQCGFSSTAHFSRVFSRRFAMTPKQCRIGLLT